MNFNKKILFISFLCLISFGIGFYWFQNHNHKLDTPVSTYSEKQDLVVSKDHSPDYSVEKNKYLNALQKEDQLLWQELAQHGLSKKSCADYKKKYAQEYKKSRNQFENYASKTPVSQKTLDMVYRIFDEFNIDRESITIIPINDPSCPAGATDYQLLIDEKHLLQYPPEAQESTIAHEVQHIINQDDSTSFIIEKFIKFTEKDIKNPDHIVNKRSRFEEKRADVLASLKNPTYAEGTILFMKKMLAKHKRETGGITHPKESIRISLAKNILNNHHHITNISIV